MSTNKRIQLIERRTEGLYCNEDNCFYLVIMYSLQYEEYRMNYFQFHFFKVRCVIISRSDSFITVVF